MYPWERIKKWWLSQDSEVKFYSYLSGVGVAGFLLGFCLGFKTKQYTIEG